MNDDLISRAKLLAALDHARTHGIGVREAVKSVPAEDAEIVRHGRWTKKDNSKTCTRIGDYEEWYECSECEGSAERESEFCPWCRAKMDAKEDA